MKANHSDKVHRRLLSLCLVSLLAGVYLLTYRGFPVSIDELSLFSTTESLVKYRELQIVSLYHEYPIITNLYTDTPWQGTLHEPLQIFLTAPFYWIAQHIDGIGLLHTVWTFNVVVVTLTTLIIYRGGVAMGYSDAAAWITAVMTAFGTMLWHYSQTFFREPLAGLLLLITFVLAYQIQRNRAQLLLAWMLLAFIGAVLTKAAALLTLPALIFILLPDFSRRDQSRLWRVMLAIMILLILAFAVGGIIPNDRFDIGHYVSRLGTSDTGYIRAVVGAYLFSPGRSIWATCPILLLAFVGAWMAYRDGKRRFALAPFILVVTWALGYGLGGWDWHGGRGWGARYLLPVVPVMSLLLLPVIQYLIERGRSAWWMAVAVLMGFSVMIQFGGVLVSLDKYYEFIPTVFPTSALDAFYNQGTWQIRYTQWYISLREFDLRELDIAWSYVDEGWRGIVVGILLILTSGAAFRLSRRKSSIQSEYALTGIFVFLITAGYGFALVGLQNDPRIFADRQELHQLVQAVEAQVPDGDIIFLSDPDYRDFFLNAYKGKARLVTLPYAPGERYSFEQIPEIITDNPDERVGIEIRVPLNYAARNYDSIWLVTNLGPFHAFAYRPVEQYLVRHFYRVGAVEDIAPNARLIHFDTTPAPTYDYHYGTLYITDREPFAFGESVLLSGYDFLAQIHPGEVLPVALQWESTGRVDFDYNIGVFLINDDGSLVAESNGQPQGSFGYTSRWEPGVLEGDNHGVWIPEWLPAGRYRLQVVMYDWRDSSRLSVTKNDEPIEGDFAEIGDIEVKLQ